MSFRTMSWLLLGLASPVWAGMPQVMLHEVARWRLQSFSMFLLAFLGAAFVFQRIWLAARSDFPKLPPLSFKGALGVLGVWGLLVLVVLTMISGARELLTPGAWTPDGATYTLETGVAPATPAPLSARRENLWFLREALWSYAAAHDGQFPPHDAVPQISEKLWRLPGTSLRLIYVPGRLRDQGELPLVYEPGVYGAERVVLMASGQIVSLSRAELQACLQEVAP